MSETSETLLGLLKTKDPKGWEAFHELYPGFIRGVLARMGLTDTDDLLQDVVVTVLEAVPGFDRQATGAFRGWLRKITRNRALAFLKANRRNVVPRVFEELELLADDASDPSRQWDEEHDRHILGKAIELARSEYGERVYQAFLGTAVLGRPAADVADELGMTPAAVYVARHRVQSRVRALVHDFIDESA